VTGRTDYLIGFCAALLFHVAGLIALDRLAGTTEGDVPAAVLEKAVPLRVHLLDPPTAQVPMAVSDPAPVLKSVSPIREQTPEASEPAALDESMQEPEEQKETVETVETTDAAEEDKTLPVSTDSPKTAAQRVPVIPRQSSKTSEKASAKPRLRTPLRPVYPLGSRLRGEEGDVRLTLYVTPDGKVGSADVLSSSGYEALDQAALKAVHAALFEPVRRDSRPVSVEVTVTIRFRIE